MVGDTFYPPPPGPKPQDMPAKIADTALRQKKIRLLAYCPPAAERSLINCYRCFIGEELPRRPAQAFFSSGGGAGG